MIKKKQACDYFENDYEKDDYELYHKYYYEVSGVDQAFSNFFIALIMALLSLFKRAYSKN